MPASSVRRNSGSFGLKKARGCGSKVSAAAGRPSALARRDGGADHGAVAAVHAVEIADGDDRAPQGVIGRDIAHDPETLGSHRAPKVKRNLPA